MNQQFKNLLSLLIMSLFFFISSLVFYKNSSLKNNRTYVFDITYSPYLKLESQVSYTGNKTIKTSKCSEIIFGKIAIPVFQLSKNPEIYLSEKCEKIENVKLDKYQNLILLDCADFNIIPEIYKSAKHLNLVSISLIDNRRWQIVISKHHKLITIDFPAETPNIQKFEELDEKYNLTDKYTYIDLRFPNRIRNN